MGLAGHFACMWETRYDHKLLVEKSEGIRAMGHVSVEISTIFRSVLNK
jgi:hypothetical protein